MKMRIFHRLLLIILWAGVSMFACGSALAQTQEVSFSPAALAASQGQAVQLDFNYQVPDGKRQTTGLGIRIHYNSKAVGDFRLQDLYAEGLVAQDESAQDDLKDLDNDPLTDKYMAVAWVGIQGEWPSLQGLPLRLGKISFILLGGGLETHLNVTTSSKPAGYNFRGQGAGIKMR